jgi:Domain of unknown function (DUF4388)
MSLVGSLEDLGLGDILQIVSLSRKSGVLVLRSDSGDGRIVLSEGLVRGASIKGEPEDLRGLLLTRGEVPEADFERAVAQAEQESISLEAALDQCAQIDHDTLETLRRDHVERAVFQMFLWRAGEFSFEVRDQIDPADGLLIETGINTQYLAMEATRLRDESAQPSALPQPVESELAPDDAPMFSGEAEARSREVEKTDEEIGPSGRASDDVAESPQENPVDALAAATVERVDTEAASDPVLPEPPVEPAPPPREAFKHLVAIDPQLAGLEWFKDALAGLFERIHIFQRSEAGIDRIRQYLGRGTIPVVVLSPRAAGDPVTGVRDVGELIRRLRALAPRIPVVALAELGGPAPRFKGIDAVVYRPASPGLDPERWSRYQSAAERLRAAFSPWVAGAAAPGAASGPDSMDRLRQVSARLRDPSTQGEVLSLVLDFAAEAFSRVAVFMIRDDVAVGMAQRGLQRAGGPDDETLRSVQLTGEAIPELFRAVLEVRRPVRSVRTQHDDPEFAALLGTSAPAEAYCAPIESCGCVVAVLYADNLPGSLPLPDTAGLEVVLHEAGLALDRALLERTLANS